MADQKVSDLPSLNGVDVDPADLLYIVDSSAGTAGSKKITIGQFQLSPWSAGTVNGVVYFDGSKVPASSSALTFDGTNLVVGSTSVVEKLSVTQGNIHVLRTGGAKMRLADQNNEVSVESLPVGGASEMVFKVNTSEVGRFTTTGNLGVGTATPNEKLDVVGAIRSTTASGVAAQLKVRQAGWGDYWLQIPVSENALAFVDNGTGTPVERARFNSLGNFGLGNVPLGTARLTVYGPTNQVQIRTDDGNVTAYVGYSSGTGASAVNIYGTATDHDQVFITKNVEVVRMKKTGQMRFQPLAAAPTPAEAGDVYYDSGTNKLRCYNGTTWNDLF